MKGRVLIIITGIALIIGFLVYRGYFDGPIIKIQARVIRLNCSDKTTFMQVVTVDDKKEVSLVDQFISPEIIFKQKKLDSYLLSQINEGHLQFYLEGYTRKSGVNHCSDASCFRVKRIKFIADKKYTEF